MVNRDLIRFYFDTMALNEHLMQWYRAVFVAFQVGVVFTMLTIMDTTDSEKFMFSLLGFGLLISLLWVFLTSQRANIVESQKNRMLGIVDKCNDPDIANCVKIYRSKLGKYLPEFIFNLFLPVAVGGLLITICEYSMCKNPSWYWSGRIGIAFSLLLLIIWVVFIIKGCLEKRRI